MTEAFQNARDLAVHALRDWNGNVSGRLDELLDRGQWSAPDRALARELALGVVRRRATLQAVLRAFLKDPARRLPAPLDEVLQVAVYQLLFLERVPNFAIVNEAVEQTTRFHHRRQSGLVNGVLRNLAREMGEPANLSPTEFPRNAVPLSRTTWRPIGREILPDPNAQPGPYLADAFSLPQVLADRWAIRFGLAKAADIAAHSAARPPLILRVNLLRSDPPAVLRSLADDHVQAVLHANGRSLVVRDWVNVRELRAFREGLVQPQDPTATSVVDAARPAPDSRVLDFCAAPGTKTTHLAEAMANRGEILAVDVSPDKIARIESGAQRMGATIVRALLAEQVGGLDPQSFDLALADVPCSNTGVLARRCEARWRFSPSTLGGIVRDQRTLLLLASSFVRKGGRLIYSTCSIEPEECDGVVRAVLRSGAKLSLEREHYTLPSGADDPTRWCDGGYYAILRVE